MRRISTTTRWLAGVGVGCVAALSVFFASRAPSGSGATPPANTPATTPATAPVTTPATAPAGGVDPNPSATVRTVPATTAPPMTYAPSRHTTSRGS